jgi:hypothetical protein
VSERDELALPHGFARGPGTRAHAGLAVAPLPHATAAAAFAVIEWTVWGGSRLSALRSSKRAHAGWTWEPSILAMSGLWHKAIMEGR